MLQRRLFLKGGLAAGAVGVAVSAGLLTPRAVVASWNADAFNASSVEDAMSAALGSSSAEMSDAIKLKAPDIAENGAVVPVTVSSDMSASAITLMAPGNNLPMVGTFHLDGANAYVSTRIKMGKTADVIAVVKSGDKLYMAKKEVKVTIGGCGG